MIEHFSITSSFLRAVEAETGNYFFPPVLFPYCPSLEISSFCWVYSIVTDGKNKAKNV